MCFLSRFHPLQFQLPHPDVLQLPSVKACLSPNIRYEQYVVNEADDAVSELRFPLVRAMLRAEQDVLLDRLQALLGGYEIPERTVTCT